MIEHVTAVEFVQKAKVGRTAPLIMVCETAGNETVELFCKFSDRCEQGVIHLAREAFAACLAADLKLPIPKPYIVDVPDELLAAISDSGVAGQISRSSRCAFGSTRVGNQFSAWVPDKVISRTLLPMAAATLFFDGIIQNPDRRIDNPNCLFKGDEIRLIDHELGFATRLIIGWCPPWEIGGMAFLAGDAAHIFVKGLKGKRVDFDAIALSWSDLSESRLREYALSIPPEWAAATVEVEGAVALVQNAVAEIDGCIEEVRRILA